MKTTNRTRTAGLHDTKVDVKVVLSGLWISKRSGSRRPRRRGRRRGPVEVHGGVHGCATTGGQHLGRQHNVGPDEGVGAMIPVIGRPRAPAGRSTVTMSPTVQPSVSDLEPRLTGASGHAGPRSKLRTLQI
jgi:hypothetical protein